MGARVVDETAAHLDAARSFNQSSALLALSVLADSSIEHYRGAFANKAMVTPLITSILSLAAGLHGRADSAARTHRGRHAIYLAAASAGIAGTGFHLYNITKRPGGVSWHNLFYAAPIGAPMALLLSGALGAVAERLRDEPAVEPQLFGMPAGRALGLVTALGLAGTVGEVALLHFRGAYQNPVMYAPVTAGPLACALLTHAALAAPRERWITRYGSGSLRHWVSSASAFMRGRRRAITAAGATGARTSSMDRRCQRRRASPALALAGLAALRLTETE